MINTTLATQSAKFVGTAVFSGIAASFVGILPALLAIFLLVTVDFITGIIAALKNKVKIESHKMRKTVVKLLCYMTAISLGALIDGAVQISLNLGTFVAMFCCITEATSVVENLGRITGHDAFDKLKDIFGNKRDSMKM